MARKKRPENVGETLLTLEDVSQYLQMSHRTMYLWAQSGKIPGFKLGNLWRFRQADIDAWIEESKISTPRRDG